MMDAVKRLAPGFAPRTMAMAVAMAAALAAGLIAAPGPAAAESGFSGLHVQGMSLEIAKALDRNGAEGVLVRDIAVGGPAAAAGVLRGDLILTFAGKKIDSFKRMVAVAGATRPGQKVKLDVLRGGKPVTLSMTLGTWTDAWRVTNATVASHPPSGLTLASLTQKLRKGFGLRWGSVGVVVTLVDPDRSDIGLRRGDLIKQVNQLDVWLPDQVFDHYKAAKKDGRPELLLLIERINGFHFMLLPVR